MLLKNKGFYMAELLLSLAGWILITSMIIPLFMRVKMQSLQIEEKSAAFHILYEYIQMVIVESPERENTVITRENNQYELLWQEGEMEVCIRYVDVFKQNVNLCETLQ